MKNVRDMDISQAASAIRLKSISPVALAETMLDRIAKIDPELKAFVEVQTDAARSAAVNAEAEINAGQYRGPLHGIPIAIKAIYDVEGGRCTSSSKVRESYTPAADCTVVRRLRSAGAVILGIVSTHEFAFGFDSIPTKNAWNLDHIPSGSSGGTAAAVAAGLCFAGTGSDTGGSIRAPAAVNGIAGIKPTYGRVSKAGVTVLSWSLDHTGPMAKTVTDLAILLGIMSGLDPDDPHTKDVEVPDYVKALSGDIRGLRIGVPRNYFFEDIQSPVGDAVMAAIERLESLGAKIVPVTIPDIDGIIDAWLPIAMAEASTYHQEGLRKHPELYGEDVRFLLEAGELTLATTYINASRVRSAWKATLKKVMLDLDVILTPTLPNTAMKVGQTTSIIGNREESVFAVSARFCAPFNMAGLPAASVPCGFDPSGLPIGLQIIGKPFDEATVLKVAHAYESNTDWHLRKPAFPGVD